MTYTHDNHVIISYSSFVLLVFFIITMAYCITVEGKVIGQRRPIFSDWFIPIPTSLQDSPLTLRDLIACVVRIEVQAFQKRQSEQKLQQFLSKEEINNRLVQGKVTMGDRDFDQNVDQEAAIKIAIMGFIDGLYYVFLDDVQQEDLDATVHLNLNSRLTFIRLVALVGG